MTVSKTKTSFYRRLYVAWLIDSGAATSVPALMTVTGMPALASIKSVVAARPGIITSADLPLRGFAGRFKQS